MSLDLTAPEASYQPPPSLSVGQPITPMTPVTTHGDIAHWEAEDLPSGLAIDPDDGIISGAPDAVSSVGQSVTVTLRDVAGNTATATVAFPLVAKGEQDLSGFAYTPNQVLADGGASPALTAPTPAEDAALSYSAEPSGLCTVGQADGTLSHVDGIGVCTVTVTAAATDNYVQSSATTAVAFAGWRPPPVGKSS